jgi:hypothetical protein
MLLLTTDQAQKHPGALLAHPVDGETLTSNFIPSVCVWGGVASTIKAITLILSHCFAY